MTLGNFTIGGRRFHPFVFADTEAVSDELILSPNDHFRYAALMIVDDWDAADIGFEVQIGSDDTNWRPLADDDGLIVLTTPTVNQLIVAPVSLPTALSLNIKKLRLVSWSTGTTTPVNQSPATTVNLHLL